MAGIPSSKYPPQASPTNPTRSAKPGTAVAASSQPVDPTNVAAVPPPNPSESQPMATTTTPSTPSSQALSGVPGRSTVYSWGRAKNYRLGRRHVNTDTRVPEPIPFFVRSAPGSNPSHPVPATYSVKQAACGGGHTCVLMEDGSLRVFGYSQYGQLGVGDRVDVCDPAELRFDADGGVVQVSCGRYHTLALTANGKMYSWGGGKNGRLGHGDEKILTSPHMIYMPDQNDEVVMIACGYHSNLALTQRGDLYSWGWGAHGQLGHGNQEDCFVPTKIEAFKGVEILSIACGDRHSFAITKDGQLFGWGSNEYGQLGTGKKGDVFTQPTLIKGLMGLYVSLVSSGDRHSAAVTNLGSVYTWGCGTDGQIGHGDYRDSLRPKLLESLPQKALDLKCGHNFTLVMTEAREVYSWGNNVYGQLGNEVGRKCCLPRIVQLPASIAVRGIACAHFHCILWTVAESKDGLGSHSNSTVSAHPMAGSNIVVATTSKLSSSQGTPAISSTPLAGHSSSSETPASAKEEVGTILEALKKLENTYQTRLQDYTALLAQQVQERQSVVARIEERLLEL